MNNHLCQQTTHHTPSHGVSPCKPLASRCGGTQAPAGPTGGDSGEALGAGVGPRLQTQLREEGDVLGVLPLQHVRLPGRMAARERLGGGERHGEW